MDSKHIYETPSFVRRDPLSTIVAQGWSGPTPDANAALGRHTSGFAGRLTQPACV